MQASSLFDSLQQELLLFLNIQEYVVNQESLLHQRRQLLLEFVLIHLSLLRYPLFLQRHGEPHRYRQLRIL